MNPEEVLEIVKEISDRLSNVKVIYAIAILEAVKLDLFCTSRHESETKNEKEV